MPDYLKYKFQLPWAMCISLASKLDRPIRPSGTGLRFGLRFRIGGLLVLKQCKDATLSELRGDKSTSQGRTSILPIGLGKKPRWLLSAAVTATSLTIRGVRVTTCAFGQTVHVIPSRSDRVPICWSFGLEVNAMGITGNFSDDSWKKKWQNWIKSQLKWPTYTEQNMVRKAQKRHNRIKVKPESNVKGVAVHTNTGVVISIYQKIRHWKCKSVYGTQGW